MSNKKKRINRDEIKDKSLYSKNIDDAPIIYSDNPYTDTESNIIQEESVQQIKEITIKRPPKNEQSDLKITAKSMNIENLSNLVKVKIIGQYQQYTGVKFVTLETIIKAVLENVTGSYKVIVSDNVKKSVIEFINSDVFKNNDTKKIYDKSYKDIVITRFNSDNNIQK